MKIAVLGGGLTGLTSCYYLSKKGHQVFLFEKNKNFGGLASGFKQKNWQWRLEYGYHHLFANDDDILNFSQEIGFKKILFQKAKTSSYYNSRIIPVDSPQDLLKFPNLSLIDKLRTGLILAFLKISPFFSFYEKIEAEKFLRLTMGEKSWQILWQQLFRKKFGKYAENILMVFFWARIKKRTPLLAYPEGGFQNLIDYLVNLLKKKGVVLKNNYLISSIEKKDNYWFINKEKFDAVISTLPTPVFINLAKKVFPLSYLQSLKKINYLWAMTIILETDKPLFEKTYWLNVLDKNLPIMGIIQHTNFIEKKYYNNHHLVYFGWYLDDDDPLLTINQKKVDDLIKPILKRFSFSGKIFNRFIFKAPFAQPIFDKDFVQNKPGFTTPLKNFYLANLDLTYPYDRGTNYAVQIGRKIGEMI